MRPAVGAVEEQVVPEIVAQILTGRGMAPEDIGVFVYPNYDRDLHDPFLMTDMGRAVDRIVQAAERQEQVVVYGDYDIDGITASAVLLEALRELGVRVSSYIPDRFEEGYGINARALEKLKAEGAELVVSVDCGITSVTEAQWAKEHGLDLVITDHHAVPEEIPDAVAVVNPKRPGDLYPFKDLAGVGVAFKLVQALQKRIGKPALGQEKWLLDLVALGTVCDVVTLVGENRALASFGLRVMRRTRRVGLRALAEVGGVDISQVSAYHLGYVLGPRMNAAGRLEHAAKSLELVMTQDASRARQIAAELDQLNRQRREDQDKIFAMADEMAKQYSDDPVLVLAHPEWSHGVVGIVASKLAEKWQKPVLIAQQMGEAVKGSARSRGGFNMVEAMRANAGLFTKFGGHFYAAGYTLPAEHLDMLREGLCAYYLESGAADQPEPATIVDVRLGDLEQVEWALLDELALLEPHGSGNPRPVLELKGLAVDGLSRIGTEGKHLRLGLKDGNGKRLAAIGFGLSGLHESLKDGQIVSTLGHLNKNEWQGSSSLQLVIEKITYE